MKSTLQRIGLDIGHISLITGAGVLAAMTYGIIHDQITARVCIEYFTIGHPNLLDVDPYRASPTVQGLLWGVIATWWVGLILGGLSGTIARVGPGPRLTLRDLLGPLGLLLAAMAIMAGVSGIIGFLLASSEVITLVPRLATQISAERHALFLANGWAHGASYLVGGIGGLVLCAWIVRTRVRRAKNQG